MPDLSSMMSSLQSAGTGAMNWAKGAPGGGWGAGLIGLSALSDLFGGISRAQADKRRQSLYSSALSPKADEEITRQVLARLAQFGVSPDSGEAKQMVARALAESQLQRIQAASGLVGSGTGTSGALGNTLQPLMMLSMLSNRFKDGGGSNVPGMATMTPSSWEDLTKLNTGGGMPSFEMPGG